jgi:dTDP-glucose 4,6-dehydratase
MRILVTGGLGFIGSNFITWMLENTDVEIINVDRGDYCSNIKNVSPNSRYTYVKGDITHKFHMKTIFDRYFPDIVVHYAAQSHVDNSFGTPIQFTIDNVVGTHVLLHTSHEYGKIQKFIHISTDEVYGEVGVGETSTEKSLLNPTNPYAASKAAAEFLVKSYGHSFNFPWIITRCNNVFGPKQYPEKLIPSFINNMINKKPCHVHGLGETRRNFIYVDDVSRAVEVIIDRGVIGHTYNIGTNNEYSVNEIFNKLRNKIDTDATFIHVQDRPFNDSRYCIDSSEMRKLGWVEDVSFDDGLSKTIEWYLSHRDW